MGLYISFRDRQGNWNPSINLGDEVNTAANQDFPPVSPRGEHLFFFRYQKSDRGESGTSTASAPAASTP